MSATHNITLDITKQRLRLDQSVHVRVGDASSQIVTCALTKDGAPYTPPSGSTAKIEILKADNTWSVSNATISGSNVSATLPTQAISAPGECKRAYFRLTSGSAEDTTEDFYLAVYSNATDEAIESGNYADEFNELLKYADDELTNMLDSVFVSRATLPASGESNDFNDHDTSGAFTFYSSATYENAPTLSGHAVVLSSKNSVLQVVQGTENDLWLRARNYRGDWTSWRKLSNEEDIETLISRVESVLDTTTVQAGKTNEIYNTFATVLDIDESSILGGYFGGPNVVAISDESGNVGAYICGGFDSRDASVSDSFTTYDIAIADVDGNVVFALENGKAIDRTTNKLAGKSFSIVGDSMSTFSGWNPAGYKTYYPKTGLTDVSETWWHSLMTETGMVLWNNAAWSGSKVCGNSLSDESAAAGCSNKRISDIAAGYDGCPDFIIVFIGGNDFALGTPSNLGDFSPSAELPAEGTVTEFADAYTIMINKIRETYPLSKVICCTMTEWKNVKGDTTYPVVNSKGYVATQYNEQIKKVADAFSCTLCDTHACGLSHWNADTYTIDADGYGVHANPEGMKFIKNAVKRTLESIA